MGRGMPRRGGRGGGGRGGSGAVRGGHPKHEVNHDRVAKPQTTLPHDLLISPSENDVPKSIHANFPEFTNIQSFFSILERLSPEYAGSMFAHKKCWLGSSISNIERDTVDLFRARIELENGQKHNVFVKRIHLLDPIRFMEGEYVTPHEGGLAAPSELWKTALAKINDQQNEAYVDALFSMCASALVETQRSPHWCRSFGTFSSRVSNYMFNITDDYESLRHRPWWRRNQRLGIFTLVKNEEQAKSHADFMTTGISNIDDDDFVEVCEDDAPAPKTAPSAPSAPSAPTNELVSTSEPAEDTDSPIVNLATPKLRLKPISPSSNSGSSFTDDEVDDCDDDCEDDYEDDEEILQYVEFEDFPVQVTLLERAEGTMDELLDEEDEDDATMLETKEARWSAWLFQVIAALTCAQHYYGFVHNDLHTNNIMWCTTTDPYLYYRIHKRGGGSYIMRIPTFGKLMKIIDFGRATYHLPDPAGFFIPDAFFPGNDAATQYNCEPFYDPKEGMRVEPNPSFDLSRLSVSLLESLYSERPDAVKPVKIMSKEGGKMYSETVSGVYNMLWEWLIDDSGHNILRLSSGKERYPDFDLYRAIAAEVHKAVPRHQIERGIYQSYKYTEKVPNGVHVYDLHI
jgi:hypothetical protein